MELKMEDEAELLQQVAALLYPPYPPGCPPHAFLLNFEPLFQAIRRFDQTAYDLENTASIEQATDHIIKLLNHALSHSPRKQFADKLMQVLARCTNHLKNLAVGKQAQRYSHWTLLPNKLIQLIQNTSDTSLRTVTDQLYLKHKRIPHLELLLSQYPGLLEAQQKIQMTLTGKDSRLTAQHHHYLAIIAASTFGSKYLWNRAVGAFLNCGGNSNWLLQGITAAPKVLQFMSGISSQLAYSPRELLRSNPFSSNSPTADRQYLLQAIITLLYYQCLACLALTTGLIPENSGTYEDQYLPKINLSSTSYQSFETVRKCEDLQDQQEQEEAQSIGSLFLLQPEEQTQLMNQFKSAKSVADRKAVGFRFVKQIQHKAWCFEEPAVEQKMQNLRCFQQLKRTYGKFVNLNGLTQAYKLPLTKSQDELVLASEWQLQMQGLKRLESVMGRRLRGELAQLMQHLKVLQPEQSRRLTHYYQFYNGYIHQFISYTKLLQQLTLLERGYLKLISKSPFLFAASIYERMDQQFKLRGIDPLKFTLSAINCKLQLGVTMTTLLFDRAYEEDEVDRQ